MSAIQVNISVPGPLTPERVSELVTMFTSRLHWELSNRLREQKRDTRQRAAATRERYRVKNRLIAGDFDRQAIRHYLAANPAASDAEVNQALHLCRPGMVAGVRAELKECMSPRRSVSPLPQARGSLAERPPAAVNPLPRPGPFPGFLQVTW